MSLSHLILRKAAVMSDAKLHLAGSNGRKVAVTELRLGTEMAAQAPEWKPPVQGEPAQALVVGKGGAEVATFTQVARQQRHFHVAGTEIYTVLEGVMRIRIADCEPLELSAGDEVIILPGTVHEVLPDGEAFLTRVHSIACGGAADKFSE